MPFPLICLSTMPPELWLLLAVVIVSAIARLLSPECTPPHELPPEHNSLEPTTPKPPPNNADDEHTPLPSTPSINSTACATKNPEENVTELETMITECPEENETEFETMITECNKDDLQKVEEVICNQSFKSEDLHFSAEEINESHEKGCDLFGHSKISYCIKAQCSGNCDK